MILFPRLRARRAGLSAARSRRRSGLSHLQGQCLEERINLAVIPAAPPGFTETTTTLTQSTPVAISATGTSTNTSTIVVAGAGSYLLDLNLTTFIQHTFSSDLDVTITSPAGTVVTLTSDNGGTFDDVFNGTVWDDGTDPGGPVPGPEKNNNFVAEHTYTNLTLASPLTPEEALGEFLGEDPNGTWTITVFDDTNLDGGSLNSWSMELTTLPTAPTTQTTTSTNSTPAAISATGTPTVISTIVISGLSPYLLDLNVTTFLTHSFSSDLDVTITSPAGTVVTLTSDNGSTFDNVFNGTVWDDNIDPGSPVGGPLANQSFATEHTYTNLTLASPLIGEEPLAAFIGEDPNGTWTITVFDDSNLDGGSLDSWSLEITSLSQPLDFGDAPAPYPTLTVDDGARHIATGPQLGTTRDDETDGQPNVGATGDDAAGTDDEGGVSITPLQRGQNSLANFVVTNAPSGALIDAWIDFNGDGDWTDAGEQIAASVAVINGGGNNVIFGVPGDAVLGATYARVRISSAGGLAPTGLAADGEVEDYLLNIQSVVPAAPTGFTATTTLYTQSTPTAISASGTPTVTSTIVVTGAGPYLLDLNLQTFLAHTFSSDLDVTIRSPAGTVVTLTTDNGSTFDNVFNGTVWDDDANPAGQVPYTTNNGVTTDSVYANNVVQSSLTPEEAFGAFVGEDPNGTWTITISDDSNLDGGSLDSWDLEITTLNAAPTTVVGTFSNTTPTVISAGAASVVTSTITIAGAPTYLLDVNMITFLRHTFSSDLDVTLRSPSGTIITITTDNGSTFDNVFNGTRWDDDANPAGQVPYLTNNGVITDHVFVDNTLASPLVPEEGLGAFTGENPNGVWTLTISDDSNLDGGSLDSWSLEFAFPAAPLVLTPGTATIVPDPISPSTGLLLVVGTSANDTILIDPISGDRTQVKLNGKVIAVYPNASFARIRADGLGGNDKIVVNAAIAKPAELNGNAGNDTLYGGAGNDTINGGTENDTLFGGKGMDLLHGDAGNDSVYGQDGNDTMFGDAGIDKMWGEAGGDFMRGGTENDSLYGGVGSDYAYGEEGDDVLYGDSEGDSLDGGIGNDTLNGGTGNDFMQGGADKDKMLGGDGNDSLIGGDGDDSIDGGKGDDYLSGDANNDTLLGGDGNDTLVGGVGNDTMGGGAGNDTMEGGDDADKMTGDAGNDLMFGDLGNDSMNGGAGNDTMAGGDDNDTMLGDAGNDLLRGGAGNDTVSGGAGNDVLLGNEGLDKLNGDNDKDILIGGEDSDILNGGAGDDVLVNGTTDHDADDAALALLIAEWGSTRTYAVRVANLRNGTGPVLAPGGVPTGVALNPNVTTTDDAAVDTLTGAAGVDWFLAELSDTLTDRAVATEQLN